jgi:hypothetical protein
MRVWGFVALLIGVLGFIGSSAMDTSVSTGDPGRRVHNIGLMQQQQNMLLTFALLGIGGVVMMVVGGRRNATAAKQQEDAASLRPCPFCAEPIRVEAIKCKHCGSDVAAHAAEENARREAAVAAQAEADKALAAKPKGQCPNCSAVIPLDSAVCPKCDAAFGVGSAWVLKPVASDRS